MVFESIDKLKVEQEKFENAQRAVFEDIQQTLKTNKISLRRFCELNGIDPGNFIKQRKDNKVPKSWYLKEWVIK